MFAIIFDNAVANYINNASLDNGYVDRLKTYFGSLSQTLLTLFMAPNGHAGVEGTGLALAQSLPDNCLWVLHSDLFGGAQARFATRGRVDSLFSVGHRNN